MKKNNSPSHASQKGNETYETFKKDLALVQLRKSKKRIFYDGISYAIIIAGCTMTGFYFTSEQITRDLSILSLIMGIVGGIINGFYKYLQAEIQETQLKSELSKYEVENIQDKIEKDIFENSIKMSYKYLDQYYSQTREQAQRGFIITILISIFGALLIAVGIIAMFLGKTNPSYVTCASGIVTEFISAIFFYLYNKTITSMSKYHNKLVLSHNVSIALKIADSLPDEEKKTNKSLIISELIKNINTYMIKNDLTENP